jgi:hypothetical protein
MYKELANMGSSKHLGRLFQRNTKRSCFYVGKQNGGFKEKQKKRLSGFQIAVGVICSCFRGPFLTLPLGANFDPRGEVASQE